MTVRLMATDLDGTIVRSDGEISERTRAALAAAEDAGILVVFVTGRPPRWMKPVSEATGHTGLAICANGAVVYDLHTEQVVEEHTLDVAVARQLAVRLREALPGIVFAVEHGGGFLHERGYQPTIELPVAGEVDELEALITRPVTKLLARHNGMGAHELATAAGHVVQELATLSTYTFGDPTDGLLELSAAGVTKAFSLERLAAGHGITADEVLAFGDMPNDLPMLAWAGRAVAVANAHPDVLAIADEVTSACDDDGVAKVIERYLL